MLERPCDCRHGAQSQRIAQRQRRCQRNDILAGAQGAGLAKACNRQRVRGIDLQCAQKGRQRITEGVAEGTQKRCLGLMPLAVVEIVKLWQTCIVSSGKTPWTQPPEKSQACMMRWRSRGGLVPAISIADNRQGQQGKRTMKDNRELRTGSRQLLSERLRWTTHAAYATNGAVSMQFHWAFELTAMWSRSMFTGTIVLVMLKSA